MQYIHKGVMFLEAHSALEGLRDALYKSTTTTTTTQISQFMRYF